MNTLVIVQKINSFFWNFLLLFLLCGTGAYFTFKLRFVQVRKFKESFKKVFGSIKFKGERAGNDGMSSFQSLATAIAAQVGTGNLAGAATAIASGGPGSIFWMWVSAFFGMSTSFAEATLAQKYKTQVNGDVVGGPSYYIRSAFKGKLGSILSKLFSIFAIFALGFMGSMVQSNSIGTAFNTAFNFNPLIVGIILSIICLFIFLGGLGRIASVTEKLVPIMAAFYIIGGVFVILLNISSFGEAMKMIFVGAFNPQAILGGIIGSSIKDAIRYGVARGLFSNEAGMGSTPHAHAMAKAKHPVDQGIFALMGVFVDTFIILTITAFVILTTGVLDGKTTGIELTQAAFTKTLGSFGGIFIAICLLFFAFSTIIGWYFFGEANVKFLLGKKATKIYAIIVAIFVVIGCTLKVEIVWELTDMFNGFMVIPNLIALLALSGVVSSLLKEHETTKKIE